MLLASACVVAILLAALRCCRCLRTLLPVVLLDRDAVQAAYAVDASASELTWICGPPLALGLGVIWSTSAALVAGGFVLLVRTPAFAAQPASRGWRPIAATGRPRRVSSRRRLCGHS